jgi:hypothetical protein
MAIIYWTNDAGGDFTTTSDWSTGTVPGVFDQVRINAPTLEFLHEAVQYTVTSSGNETVLSLTTIPNTILDITGGFFAMSEGTGIGANDGQIDVGDGAGLVAGGTFDNTNSILIQSSGDTTQLNQSTYLTLSGGGQVVMSDNANNEVDITTNVNNIISGAGTVYLSNNEKNGEIIASDPTPLEINNDGQALINAGTLEATSNGKLDLYGTINDSSGGLIEGSGIVVLDGVTIIGGTLDTTHGVFNPLYVGTSTLDGITATVNNEGSLVFSYVLALEGTINNTGSIASGIDSYMDVDAAGVTLEGGGTISLDESGSFIFSNAASAELTNVNNTISGEGFIGDNGSNALTLINKGVIDGNGSDALIIDTGSNAVTNTGTLETVGTLSELYIASSVTNSGKLIANGGDLVAAGVVTGGSATIESTGTVEFGAASNVGTSFASTSIGELILDDAAQYTGTISGFGANTTQSIDLPNVQFASATESYSGGTLTVKDTSGDIAHLKFSGSYKLADFTFANDGGGGTLITDPPVTKTTPTTGVNIALLGNYIASSLVGGSVGQGGSLPTDPWAIVSPHMLATPAHA